MCLLHNSPKRYIFIYIHFIMIYWIRVSCILCIRVRSVLTSLKLTFFSFFFLLANYIFLNKYWTKICCCHTTSPFKSYSHCLMSGLWRHSKAHAHFPHLSASHQPACMLCLSMSEISCRKMVGRRNNPLSLVGVSGSHWQGVLTQTVIRFGTLPEIIGQKNNNDR